MRELLEHFGRDTVLVSHSRDEVYQLCSRLALLEQGEILECGETKAVFQNPGSRTGAVLTGCKNIAAARKTGEYEVEMPEWGVRFLSLIHICGSNKPSNNGGGSSKPNNNGGTNSKPVSYTHLIAVENHKGFTLPATGGTGGALFLLIGAAGILTVSAVLVKKSRKAAK